METSPAVDVQNLTDQELQLVVDEMLKFKDEMLDTLKNGHGDIKKFWLRKTHKPVLAVLLVQNPSDPNGPPILYRGTLMSNNIGMGQEFCPLYFSQLFFSFFRDKYGSKHADWIVVRGKERNWDGAGCKSQLEARTFEDGSSLGSAATFRRSTSH